MINPETPIWQLTVQQFKDIFESIMPQPVEVKKDELFMNTAEVIEYLKISKSTVVRWRNSLYLPYEKKGGIIRYRKSEIDKVLYQ